MQTLETSEMRHTMEETTMTEPNQTAGKAALERADTGNPQSSPDVTETVAKNLCDAVERRLREAGRARGLSRKGAAAVLFGDTGQPDDPRRNFADWLLSVRQNDRNAWRIPTARRRPPSPGRWARWVVTWCPRSFCPG